LTAGCSVLCGVSLSGCSDTVPVVGEETSLETEEEQPFKIAANKKNTHTGNNSMNLFNVILNMFINCLLIIIVFTINNTILRCIMSSFHLSARVAQYTADYTKQR
jgi:hypothetical protein